MTVIGFQIISLICHALHPTALFLCHANPIIECYINALTSVILCSVVSYWIITWMSEHRIFRLSSLAAYLTKITAPLTSKVSAWLSSTYHNGRYNDRRSQRRHYSRRCYTHAHTIFTKGHHRLSYRLARVLLEKSPYYPTQPSNFELTLSVPSKVHRYLHDIDSLESGTVPQHPVSRPSTIIAFATELDRGPICSVLISTLIASALTLWLQHACPHSWRIS